MMARRRVLVVDDDDGIREFVGMTLSDEGYEVLTAGDGYEALECILAARPDLILLDIRMPIMGGAEFMQAYRNTPEPRAPVIVLTAARNAGDSAARIEADAYLPKPFELEELLELVQRFVAQHET
jgi:CheY-like chemotaxis protein